MPDYYRVTAKDLQIYWLYVHSFAAAGSGASGFVHYMLNDYDYFLH